MSTYISEKRVDRSRRFEIEKIHGDCLARLGVKNNPSGYAIVDRWLTPKVGDLVHCLDHFSNIGGYIKQVKRIEGDSIIVGTAYLDETRDYEFEAGEIIGVVVETYGAFPNNYREYIRPTHLRKKRRPENEG